LAEKSDCGFLVQNQPAENRPMLLLGHIFFVPDQILIGTRGRRSDDPKKAAIRRRSGAAASGNRSVA
jgi:hypothetical protein